jgi:hypothetical protein
MRSANKERIVMQSFKQHLWAAGLSVSALACAGSEVPAKQLAEAQASIRAASEVGAEHSPDAALQLKMANDRLTRAQQLTAEGENEDAAKLLEEAEADAELALLLARKEDAQKRALQAQEKASKFDDQAAKSDGSQGAKQ